MSEETVETLSDLSPVEYQRLRNEGKTELPAKSADDEQSSKTEEAPEAEETQSETSAEPEPEQPEDEEAEKPKAKGGFQRRIDKLTAKLRLTEQERDELREKTKPAAEPVKQVTGEPEPQPDQFDTYEKFVKAQARWEVRQELAKEREEEHQRAETERLKTVFDNFNKQVTSARETYDDFDEVVGSSIEIPKSVELAIPHLENGAAVAYHLGKNPELAEKLMDMDPLQAVAYVGRISAELSAPSNGRPPDKKPVSRATAPITPVDTGNSRSSVPLADLEPSEYIRRRNAQDEKRRAR